MNKNCKNSNYNFRHYHSLGWALGCPMFFPVLSILNLNYYFFYGHQRWKRAIYFHLNSVVPRTSLFNRLSTSNMLVLTYFDTSIQSSILILYFFLTFRFYYCIITFSTLGYFQAQNFNTNLYSIEKFVNYDFWSSSHTRYSTIDSRAEPKLWHSW